MINSAISRDVAAVMRASCATCGPGFRVAKRPATSSKRSTRRRKSSSSAKSSCCGIRGRVEERQGLRQGVQGPKTGGRVGREDVRDDEEEALRRTSTARRGESTTSSTKQREAVHRSDGQFIVGIEEKVLGAGPEEGREINTNNEQAEKKLERRRKEEQKQDRLRFCPERRSAGEPRACPSCEGSSPFFSDKHQKMQALRKDSPSSSEERAFRGRADAPSTIFFCAAVARANRHQRGRQQRHGKRKMEDETEAARKSCLEELQRDKKSLPKS